MRTLSIIALLLVSGCAARQPSSTDNHHRVPQVDCAVVIAGGRFRQLCCDGEGRCWFGD